MCLDQAFKMFSRGVTFVTNGDYESFWKYLEEKNAVIS